MRAKKKKRNQALMERQQEVEDTLKVLLKETRQIRNMMKRFLDSQQQEKKDTPHRGMPNAPMVISTPRAPMMTSYTNLISGESRVREAYGDTTIDRDAIQQSLTGRIRSWFQDDWAASGFVGNVEPEDEES